MSCPKISPILTTLSLLFIFFHFAPNVADHSSLEHMPETESTIGWSYNTTRPPFTSLDEELDFEDGRLDREISEDVTDNRRSLLHYYYRSSPRRYYISYGALSANRIPCPPRSGRSYYTHNCQETGHPVNPYSRGCSSITRCRR